MKKHFPSHRTQKQKKETGFLRAVLTGAAFSLILGMALLALCCIPALALPDPLRFAPVFALVCLFVSVTAGAYLAAKLHGKSGLACGLLCALAFIGVTVAITFILSLKIRVPLFFICVPVLLLMSAIAGICGVSSSAPKMHKHKAAKFR